MSAWLHGEGCICTNLMLAEREEEREEGREERREEGREGGREGGGSREVIESLFFLNCLLGHVCGNHPNGIVYGNRRMQGSMHKILFHL